MDRERMIKLRDNMTRDMPLLIEAKELMNHLVKTENVKSGHEIQQMFIYLLDYYIDKEFNK